MLGAGDYCCNPKCVYQNALIVGGSTVEPDATAVLLLLQWHERSGQKGGHQVQVTRWILLGNRKSYFFETALGS